MESNTEKDKRRIKIGIPSSRSRLHPKVMGILGLPCYTDSHRLVFYSESATVFFLRPWDLPRMVEFGHIDVAFCGLDTVIELGVHVTVHQRFENLQSPIALCKRIGIELVNEEQLFVATEYPEITRKYLRNHYDNFEIIYVKGATEAYPHLDGISAIVDIVETRGTLTGNHLHLVDTITYTYPCLIQGKNNTLSEEKLSIERLAHLIQNALKLNLSHDHR